MSLPPGYTIGSASWDEPELRALQKQSGSEVLALYSSDDLSKQRVRPLTAHDVLDVVVVRWHGSIVATGSLTHAHPEFFEVSRVAVAPQHRRQKLGRIVLDALAARAEDRGIERLVLQTGFRQEAAIALYESAGWTRIAPYGPYAEDDIVSVCFERRPG